MSDKFTLIMDKREAKLLIEALDLLANHAIFSSNIDKNLGIQLIAKMVEAGTLSARVRDLIELPEPEYCPCGNELTYIGEGIFHAGVCDTCLGIETPSDKVELGQSHIMQSNAIN